MKHTFVFVAAIAGVAVLLGVTPHANANAPVLREVQITAFSCDTDRDQQPVVAIAPHPLAGLPDRDETPVQVRAKSVARGVYEIRFMAPYTAHYVNLHSAHCAMQVPVSASAKGPTHFTASLLWHYEGLLDEYDSSVCGRLPVSGIKSITFVLDSNHQYQYQGLIEGDEYCVYGIFPKLFDVVLRFSDDRTSASIPVDLRKLDFPMHIIRNIDAEQLLDRISESP